MAPWAGSVELVNGTEDAATGEQGADAAAASPSPPLESTLAPSDIPPLPGLPLDGHSGPLTMTDARPWGVPDYGPQVDPALAGAAGWWDPDPQTVPYGTQPAAAYGSVVAPPGIFGAPPPPRMPHRWGLGAYLLVEAVFLLVSVLLGYLFAGRLTSSAGAVALALAVPTLCAAGLAVLITRIRGNGPRIDLGLQVSKRDVLVGLACGAAGLVITIPASVLYVAIAGADASSAVGDVLGRIHAGPALAITIFVIVVFVAPLCEEIVYRGLLWGAVERLGANRWWTLVVTTVVFALAHFEFSRTPLLLVVAIPIGVARVITGRLPAGVIAHQINNLLPGIVLMLGVLGAVPMT
jgi:membrane protease YdiL (CAAX protease family)